MYALASFDPPLYKADLLVLFLFFDLDKSLCLVFSGGQVFGQGALQESFVRFRPP